MASVEYHHGSQPYSTLEVRHVELSEPQDLETSNKEAVLHPESQYPQIADSQTQETWNAVKLEANPCSEETIAEKDSTGKAKRRICGLLPRTFYIVLGIVAALIIGAIAGGIAGGLASRRNVSNTTSSPTPSGDTTPNVNVLNISSLAASNWTDAQGNVHRSVFFQDPYNSIIARQWDSQNKTWETRNISRLMQSATGGPIHPKPGTSLASASSDSKRGPLYEVQLWFSEATDDGDSISWVTSPNPAGAPYFWNYVSSGIKTWNNTQLAAAWQRCPDDTCDGYWAVAYQGPNGYIRVANSSNWTDGSSGPALRAKAVAAGASLALLPTLSGTYVDGLTLAAQRRPTYMGRSTLQANGSWIQNDGKILDGVDPLKTRQFAATMMNNWNEALFIALSNDGSVDAARWDGEEYSSIPEITFAQGQSTSFSAIATTTDAMFYGIADDQIWEYSIDASLFTHTSKVYP
ncbi:hypothetical protein Hte_000730 [Hypoxylon texense]